MDESIKKLRKYKRDFTASYTLGAFPTIELIRSRPEAVQFVLVHTKYKGTAEMEALCQEAGIPVYTNDRAIERIREKEDCLAAGVFEKYPAVLDGEAPHVVLVNPMDRGNLGTILRTVLGFGIHNLGIIRPAVDPFHPRVLRASMGARFRMNVQEFGAFGDYREQYPRHSCYPFMLEGSFTLSAENCPLEPRFSLVFGNESSGLDSVYQTYGTSVRIPQGQSVDSLNLAVAVGVGTYIFAEKNGIIQ